MGIYPGCLAQCAARGKSTLELWFSGAQALRAPAGSTPSQPGGENTQTHTPGLWEKSPGIAVQWSTGGEGSGRKHSLSTPG